MIVARASVAVGTQPLPDALRGDGPATGRPVAVVRLDAGGDLFGQGECSPLAGHSPDTFDEAVLELRDGAARLAGRPFDAHADAAALVDAAGVVWPHAPSARFALETALLDLAARASDRPLRALLGRDATPAAVPINLLLPPLGDAAACVGAVRAGLARGVSVFKAKIARTEAGIELATLTRLRDAFGSTIALRLDANRAWSLDAVAAALEPLARLRPEYVEQPVGRDELFAMRDAPVPLAADESMQRPGALARLARAPAVTTVVLKPATCGGLVRARALAGRAAQAGLGVVVTHLADGPVGLAAAAELALSLDPPPLACGLAPHAGLDAWAVRPPQAGPADVRPVDRAGLGLPAVEPPR